jgi:hypothetical protein
MPVATQTSVDLKSLGPVYPGKQAGAMVNPRSRAEKLFS